MPTGDAAHLRAHLAGASGPAVVRRLMETVDGFDDGLWRLLAARGLLTGPAPVDVAEELGASLACVPFLSSVVLAGAALGGGDAGRHGPEAAAGVATATVALEPVRATPAGEGWVLDGCVAQVIDGHTADVVLAVSDRHLFAVDGGAPGLTRSPLVTLDPTRRQARLDMVSAPARLVGDASGVVGRVLDAAAVHLAAEAAGGARRCLALAVAHAGHRQQFGRPIGAFQAVQHRLADVAVAVESARAVAMAAAEARADEDGARLLASTAKAWCAEAYLRAAEACIQVHGARGVRWDHEASLHLKRAKSSALLFGDAAWHRRRVAGLLGL